jgi:peptide/nickel transport system permease protein
MSTVRTAAAGWWTGFRRLRFFKVFSEPTGVVGFFCVVLIVGVAVFAPFLAPYRPEEINVLQRLSGPSAEHPLGTDQLGRDLLSRLIYGARVALIVSLPAVLLGAVLGLALGLIAGYYGGFIDNALLMLFDIVRSFPALLFAIAVIALTGPSLVMVIVIMGVTRFPEYGRLIRAQTLKTKEEEFVTASRALGCSTPRILARHLLPNVIAPLFILAAMDIPVVITFEAGLSFLGLGVPPPTPSWGTILREGYTYVRASPWLITFGSLTLIIATLGFTFFAEALRDAFDVRLRGASRHTG